ncbi:MAG: hypothetical protein LBP87_02865 [Planctomycetaceae bacterium]|jgi:hypothetical protein|nr:hypothetical protein [Planctomycetaceae bacterium]
MKFFLTQPVLGYFVFLFLISSGVWGTEISRGIDSVYRTNSEIISETVPIRVGETVVSYDFPYEPQIIERRIISTRIISPPVNSEIKTIIDKPLIDKSLIDKPLLPLHQAEKIGTEKIGNSEKLLDSKISMETAGEKPFQEITFPLQKEPDHITTLKPTQKPIQTLQSKPKNEPNNKQNNNELNIEQNNEPKQTPPVFSTVLGQSSSFASEVDKALNEPLPFPKGQVDASAIDPKLYENTAESTAENKEMPDTNESTSATENNSTVISKEISEKNKSKNEKQANGINGILLLVTIVSVAMLIYAIVIAFDYHQRWIQSLTTQNNRFSGLSDSVFSGDEMDADFSGNIPLYHGNSNIPTGLSHFRSESQYY